MVSLRHISATIWAVPCQIIQTTADQGESRVHPSLILGLYYIRQITDLAGVHRFASQQSRSTSLVSGGSCDSIFNPKENIFLNFSVHPTRKRI